jgi:hypothetical protein
MFPSLSGRVQISQRRPPAPSMLGDLPSSQPEPMTPTAAAWPVCTICYEDLRPPSPPTTTSSMPSDLISSPTRLFFQSTTGEGWRRRWGRTGGMSRCRGHRQGRLGAPPGLSRGTAGPESLDLGCGRKRVWKGITADEGAAKRGSNLAKPSPGEVQENGIRYTVPVWCTHITLVVNYSKKL